MKKYIKTFIVELMRLHARAPAFVVLLAYKYDNNYIEAACLHIVYKSYVMCELAILSGIAPMSLVTICK